MKITIMLTIIVTGADLGMSRHRPCHETALTGQGKMTDTLN